MISLGLGKSSAAFPSAVSSYAGLIGEGKDSRELLLKDLSCIAHDGSNIIVIFEIG